MCHCWLGKWHEGFTMTKYQVSGLFFPAQNFAERPVFRFERAKICRTGKCSAEREALRSTLFEFDNLDPKAL
jgi:hypothetical protein